MENLTDQNYEIVLEFMQETGEENFQEAKAILTKYDFDLQAAIDSLNAQPNENEQQFSEKEQMIKMRNYLLKRDRSKKKNFLFQKLKMCKKFTHRMCLCLTQKLIPEMIKRKIIRSEFYRNYHESSSVEIKYRTIQEAFYHAKNRNKHVLVLISDLNKNQCLVEFLQKKNLLAYIENYFVILGLMEDEIDGTEIQAENVPSIIALRENLYEEPEVIRRFSHETDIMGINQSQVKEILDEAKRKHDREKEFVSRSNQYSFSSLELDENIYESNQTREFQRINFTDADENANKYRQNRRNSKMILQQNKAYEEMASEIKKKEEKKTEHLKKIQQLKEQRTVRRMSIPPEPESGQIIKIIFRCPNGDVIDRKFEKNQRIDLLYSWVDLNDDIEFQEDRQFDLFYSFPPESLQEKRNEQLSNIFENEQYGKIMIREL